MTSDHPQDPPVSERLVLSDTQEEKRRQFETEMEHLKTHPPDRAKRPGGYYLNADGSGAHDSEGRPVPVDPADEAALVRIRERRAQLQAAAAPPVGESPEEVAALDAAAVKQAAGRPKPSRG